MDYIDSLRKKYQNDDPLLPDKEAAPILDVKPHTMAVWRVKQKKGLPAPDIPYIRIGTRRIRSRLSDLLAYIERRRHAGTEADQ